MSIDRKIGKALQQIVGQAHFTTRTEDRLCYAYDATARHHMPGGVIFPETTAQVSEILALAQTHRLPVIPRGAGSGMTGGALPVHGGLVMAMTRFNRIIGIDGDNLTARVEPGVITGHFHKAVEKLGLFYPPDPSSSEFSTLGGNLAECAGGPRAVKYGVTRDYVLGLEAVLPGGAVIHTGVQTVKGVVGYDLTRLIVGSEGTLGIITAMILRLLPLPESVGTLTAVFTQMETAARAVSEIIRRGIIPRAIEYMDRASLDCVREKFSIELPEQAGAMLLLEVDGREAETRAAARLLGDLCTSLGACEVQIAASAAQAERLRQARRSISPALFTYGPHKINEDIVVPRSRIPDVVRKIETLRRKTGLFMASFGHAGDGNIHFNIMLDKRLESDLKKANQAVSELFDYTLKLGGTISGEHGIGVTKSAFISREIPSHELELMKSIKRAFDPRGILNPGKIFPEAGTTES